MGKRWRWTVRLFPGCFLGLLLAGCGGAGGNPPPSAHLQFSPAALQVSAPTNGQAPAPVTVSIAIVNAPANANYIGGTYTLRGLTRVTVEPSQATQATATVYFKLPYDLAPSNYTDTLSLALCRDPACANEITGSRATLTITYTVTAPPPQALPTIWTDTSRITVSALTTGTVLSVVPGPNIVGIQIPIHTSNAAYPVSLGVQATNVTIAHTYAYAALGTIEAVLHVVLTDPFVLGVGSFHDTIQITACLDAACVNPLSSPPLLITVDYVVSDQVDVPGNAGTTLRFVQIPAAHGLVADATRDLLYVVQTGGPTNLVKVVTPSTGAVTALTASTMFSGRTMRISGDGKYLYTLGYDYYGIYRFLLPDWTLDATIPFELNRFGTHYDAADLQLVPGSSDSLAVARTYGGAYGVPADVVAFDGPVKRSNGVVTPYGGPGPAVAFLEWGADGSTLYGSSPPGRQGGSWRFAVDAGGVTQSAWTDGLGGGPMAYAAGRLFFAHDGLQVLDATSGALLATQLLPVTGVSGVLADRGLGRLYALGTDAQGQSVLYVIDVQTLAILGSTTFDNAYHPSGTMARWGSQGLAVTDRYMVYLLSGPLIAP